MTEDPPPLRVHIADAVVARVAAHRALAVPGVLALQADLGQTMLGLAGKASQRLGSELLRPPPAGASAAVRDGSVRVALTVVTRLGHNCRDLAQAVQREVGSAVSGYTGMSALVTVTIAEIVLE